MNKTIYMCYKNLMDLQKNSVNWLNLNPDWNIELYDDERCKYFLLTNYSQLFVNIFNYLKDGPIKADFWRVCILYTYGGLYIDADINPLVPLDFYVSKDDYFVTCTSHHNKDLCNPHFILAYKKNKILKFAIDMYVNYYNLKIPYKYWQYSIVKILNKNSFLKRIIKPNHKIDQIYIIDNKKYKFLTEHNINYCTYKNKIIFKNRYNHYKNHRFNLLINESKNYCSAINNQIMIGPNRTNLKIIKLNKKYHSSTILFFKDTKKGIYNYIFKNNQLIISKKNSHNGWTKDLIGTFLYTKFGSSNKSKNTFKLDKYYPPNSIISFYHNYKDKFKYNFDKDILTIQRTDENNGWGQDLNGYINRVIIGPSVAPIKKIELNKTFPIDQEIFFSNSDLEFNYEINNYILTITRKDINQGWEDKLVAHIFQIPIGTSEDNTKVINLKKEYNSQTTLSFYNINESLIHHKFNYNFIDNQLIINRIDQITGWDIYLIAYFNNLNNSIN